MFTKVLLHTKPKIALNSMTTLRARELSRKNAREEQERLDFIGGESDTKAMKGIAEEFKAARLEDEKMRERAFFYLERNLRNKLKYNELLTNFIQEFVFDEDIPLKYLLKVSWDNRVVSLSLADYESGFKSSFEPRYDLLAAKMLVIKAGNTAARLDGYVTQTDSGILIPDDGEIELILNKPKING